MKIGVGMKVKCICCGGTGTVLACAAPQDEPRDDTVQVRWDRTGKEAWTADYKLEQVT